MGLRFRKTIRLGNLARVNLSKSGASVTVGPPGASVNLGPRGAYLNCGIPGTGLSSRTRLGGPSAKRQGKGQAAASGRDGQAATQDARAQAVAERQAAAAAELEQAQAQAAELEQATLAFTELFRLAPEVYSLAEYQAGYDALTPPGPADAQSQAEGQPPGVTRQAAYESHRQWYASRLDPGAEAVEDGVEAWLADLELPVEMDAQIQYDAASGALYIDLDLPEIEHLPQTTAEVLRSGRLSIRDKTQKQLRAEYARTVFGLAILLAAGSFGQSAHIAEAVISGRTQRRDATGELSDDYIYSVRIPRTALLHRPADDPERFIAACEGRLKLSATHVFSPIVPY